MYLAESSAARGTTLTHLPCQFAMGGRMSLPCSTYATMVMSLVRTTGNSSTDPEMLAVPEELHPLL